MIRKAIIVVLMLAALSMAALSACSNIMSRHWQFGQALETDSRNLSIDVGNGIFFIEYCSPAASWWRRFDYHFGPISLEGSHLVIGKNGIRKDLFFLRSRSSSGSIFTAGVALLLAAYPGIALYRGPLRRRRRRRKGLCQQCGYDLTGNESGNCPECGTPVNPNE